MRITVDTNVLISATFWYGKSNKIIELAEQKKIILILSEAILKEFAEVLEYEEIQDKHLLKLKEYNKMPIVTPDKFLDIYLA
jgi:putative PIN family toxin of toxin-antitoxin system